MAAPLAGMASGSGARAAAPAGWTGTKAMWIALGYAAHLPLALVLLRRPSWGAVHAMAALALGLFWAALSPCPWRAAYAAAYIVGAEVLWRMTGVPVFWEFAKYAVTAIFLAAVVRKGLGKNAATALAYFGLLLPSALITIAENSLSPAINNLSFNLSGPLALTASVLFFSRVPLSLGQFRRLLLVGAAPVVGMSSVVWIGVRRAGVVAFGGSNVAMSGGFAPNQVSSVLGLAVLLLTLYLLSGRSGEILAGGLLGLLLLFATQSAMTFSRGGLYLAASCTAVAGLPLLQEPRYRRRLLIGAILVGAVAIFWIVPRLLSYTGGAIATRFTETSTTGRTEIVLADLDTWVRSPVLGVGPGQAKERRARFFRSEASHTEFTRLLAEHGLLGVGAMVCLFLLARRAVAQPAPRISRALRWSVLAWSLLFMLIDGVRLAAPGLLFGLSLVSLRVGRARPAAKPRPSPPRLLQTGRLRVGAESPGLAPAPGRTTR